MQKRFFSSLILFSVWLGLSSIYAQDAPPNSHLKVIYKTLGSLEAELKNAVKSQKGDDLSKVYFDNENTIITNYIVPENVKPNKNIEAIANKPLLNPNEFVTLLIGLYKGAGFAYEYSYDENTMTSVESPAEKSQFVHTYKIPSKVSIAGVVSELQANFQREIDLYITVYSDSKGTAKHCKIAGVMPKGKPLPKQIEKPETNEVIDLAPTQKIEKIKAIFDKIVPTTTEEQLDDIEKDLQGLMSASGAIRLVQGETTQSYTITTFIHLLKKQPLALNYVHASLILYDNYERNEQAKWFARATTYHEVSRFDKGMPIPSKVTKTEHVPMLGKSPSKKESYWLVFSLTYQVK